MKTIFLSIIFLVATGAARAAVTADDFNRENTAQTAYTVNVGNTDWVQDNDGTASGGGDWYVSSNVLRGRSRLVNSFVRNTALETISGGGADFTLSVDVSPLNSNVWIGAVFNYTDVNNYYILRIKGDAQDYQLLGLDGGVQSLLASGKLSSGTFAQDLFYTMTIASDTAGSFDFAITAQGSSTVLNSVTSVTDSTNPLTGGYAGMFFSLSTLGQNASYDNFSLEVNQAKSLRLMIITSP